MLRTYSGLKTFFLGVIASCNAGCTSTGYISRLMPYGLNSIAGAIVYGSTVMTTVHYLANTQPRPPPQP